MSDFPLLFKGLGKLDGEYNIKLHEGAQPFSLCTPRRIAIHLRNAVWQELDRMERNGVVAKITQPTEWCSAMVMVPKSNNRVWTSHDSTDVSNERDIQASTRHYPSWREQNCLQNLMPTRDSGSFHYHQILHC